MLDWRRVTGKPEEFVKALQDRGETPSKAKEVLAQIEKVSQARVVEQRKSDSLKAERNKISQDVAQLMKSGKKAEAEPLIAKGKELGAQIDSIDKQLESSESQFSQILELIPNMPHSSVPVGKAAEDNPVVRSWGEKRSFDFEPLSHDEIGQKTGLIDFERAGKVSGARFVFLRDGLARMERALANFMLDEHRKRSYQEIVPPYMVNYKTMYGIGQFPKFVEDVFKIDGQDKYLIPTAEVPVTSLFSGEIIADEELPMKFCSFTPCFRSEAGSYGKDTKGLIRQHQFHKVELVKFVHPERSLQELESMVDDAENILRLLEIPYRVIHLCTGDMGFNSQKTYDIEVWLPGSVFDTGTSSGQKPQRGCYREISSCSDCGDFQARRSQIRFKPKGQKGTQFVHTLNGSGLAVGRTLVAVIENYQKKNGRIGVPKALQPYMGGLTEI
jgi:seryl-tRNA synthetase